MIRTALASVSLWFGVLAMAKPHRVPPQALLDRPGYVVSDLAASGDGCKASDIHVDIMADGGLALTLDRLQVQVGEGIPAQEAARRCDLSLTLKHEPGWAFAVRRYEVLGQADMAQGLRGAIQLWHHNDTRRPLKIAEALDGPLTTFDYRIQATQSPDRFVWSACGSRQSLKLALALALDPVGGSQGFLGQCGCGNPDVRLELLWRPCTTAQP